MVKFRSRFKHKAAIDITALIDLVFLLVAFFLVTSKLGAESSITVHLPKGAKTSEYRNGNVTLSVDKKNNIYINDKKYTVNQLDFEFKKIKKSIGDGYVVIRGDKNSDYEMIIMLMDKLNQNGIPKFSLSTMK